jgi:hypothetical protein
VLHLGGASDGINPLTDPVTLKIGSLSLTIPAGSFHLQHRRSDVYVFSGGVGGFTVNAKFENTDFYDWTFRVNGSSPNGLSITNPVTATLSIGDDSGTRTETAPIN